MTGLVLLVGVLWVFGGVQSGVLAQDGGKFSYPRALERLESLVATMNESLHQTKEELHLTKNDLHEVRLCLNLTKRILGEVQGENEVLKKNNGRLEVQLLETRRELSATKSLHQQAVDELRVAQDSTRVALERQGSKLEKGLKQVRRKISGLEDEQLSERIAAIENEQLPRQLNELVRDLRRLEGENLTSRVNEVFIKLLTTEFRHNSSTTKLKEEQRRLQGEMQALETKLEAALTMQDEQVANMVQELTEKHNSLEVKLDAVVIDEEEHVKQLNDSVTERLGNLSSTVEEQGTCIASLKVDVEQIKLSGITDCYNAMMLGFNESGVYTIKPNSVNNSVKVFCDMETDGGGWTVLLKRQDGSVDFQRNWTDYKSGFGNLEGEHWLGLDNMHLLSHQSSDPPQLRVDLADWEGNTVFAKYDQFSVGDEDSDYTLSVSGYQSASTAGDSLTYHNGQIFSTLDRDNDVWTNHCAVYFHGPWWHSNCYDSLLTGKYYTSGGPWPLPYGINWGTWKGTYSLRVAEMKMRPGGV